MSAAREMALIVSDRDLAQGIPRLRGLHRFGVASDNLLDKYRYIFVAASLLELPQLSEFIREANRRHYLRGLFVRDEEEAHLLPQVLHVSRLRTLRNLLVHSGPEMPSRVLRAYCLGAENELIAQAKLIEHRLFVISCAGETFNLDTGEFPLLRELTGADVPGFTLAEDGSYLFWPSADLHLDLEDIRTTQDPALQQAAEIRRLREDRRFGGAIAALRKTHGVRQRDVDGLSERQVRRIEHGERTSMESLEFLAGAHGLTLNSYLEAVAQIMQSSRMTQS